MRKNIIIIISAQRHGTNYFCNRFNDISNCLSLYELFNEEHTHYKKNSYKSYDELFFKIFKDNTNINTIIFKIFNDHFDYKVEIDKICKLNILYNIKVIILERDLIDSFISVKWAFTTNDWAVNKNDKNYDKDNYKNYKNNFIINNHIDTFNQYKYKIDKFFNECKNIFKQYNIKITYLNFNEIIKPEFNFENLLD